MPSRPAIAQIRAKTDENSGFWVHFQPVARAIMWRATQNFAARAATAGMLRTIRHELGGIWYELWDVDVALIGVTVLFDAKGRKAFKTGKGNFNGS